MPSEIKLYNMDCMVALKEMPDKAFDLAIVDPPYGIGNFVPENVSKKGIKAGRKVLWNDKIPIREYFNELNRVSINQIIWGANYYNCFSANGGALIWHKGNINPIFSQCEIASLSFQKKTDYVFINWQAGFFRNNIENVIHPCQKPISLYKWLLKNYAKPGDKILDTHGGSMSSMIACYDMGFDATCFEIDKEYFDAAVKRLENHKKQLTFI